MRLRGLLKLVTTLVVVVPSSISVAACNNAATDTRTNLSTITSLSGVRFTLDITKKYSNFDSVIAQATEFSSKPLTNYTVKYYDAATGGTEITDNLQTGDGQVYVVITVGTDDKNWKGSTSDITRIAITVEGKIKLDTVNSIDDLSSGNYFNPSVPFSALDPIIKNSTAFATDTLTDYTVKYYDAATGGTDITNKMQTAIKVYVVITASSDDPLWEGSTSDTNRLFFTLNKVDLNTITTLTGLNLTTNTSQTYSTLDSQLASATEFTAHPLVANYTVNWYQNSTGGSPINNTNQVPGTVYVEITAAPSDGYWTGTTPRITVELPAFNLVSGTLGEINATVLANDGTIYVGSSNGNIYKKRTSDSTFSAIPGTIAGGVFSLAASSDGIIFAGSTSGQVYKSDGSIPFVLFGTVGTGNVTVMHVGADKSVYAVAMGIAYRCLDGQTTFNNMTGSADGPILSLTSASDNEIFGGTTTGKVYAANPNANFSGVVSGTTGQVTSLYSDSNDNLYAGTSTGGIYKSTSGQTTFNISIAGGTGIINGLVVISTGDLYAANKTGSVFKVNSGSTNVNTILSAGTVTINSITMNTANKVFIGVTIGTGTGGVYESL